VQAGTLTIVPPPDLDDFGTTEVIEFSTPFSTIPIVSVSVVSTQVLVITNITTVDFEIAYTGPGKVIVIPDFEGNVGVRSSLAIIDGKPAISRVLKNAGLT